MSLKHNVLIKNGFLIYPEKTIKADIGIDNGKISSISKPGTMKGDTTLDAEGNFILPGLIDPHTHPVYLDSISDVSKTGAFGGVTTVIHYAYAKPGKSLIKTLKDWKAEGESTSYTDFALHGGLFETKKQAPEIPEAFAMGVTSFKMFMSYAKLGWMTDDYALAMAMEIIGKHRGLAALHAENGLVIDYIQDKLLEEKADFAERFIETSPDLVEAEAIIRAAYIGRLMNCKVYIPHISSAEGIKAISFLKQNGYGIYGETCPHYLSFTWDELKRLGPLGKVGPSIKTEKDRRKLWEAIETRLIDTIGSDHAPKDKTEKDDFFKAPYGSPGIETMLPAVWHYGVNSGKITPNRLVEITSENTAKIFGLFPRKGRLEKGSDADIVIFDPREEWTVTPGNQHGNAKYTLYQGRSFIGRVKTVLSKGKIIVQGNDFLGTKGDGQFLATRIT